MRSWLFNGDFYELCESQFFEEIGEKILRERRDEERRNIYDVD
jgi:hypothetical protein